MSCPKQLSLKRNSMANLDKKIKAKWTKPSVLAHNLELFPSSQSANEQLFDQGVRHAHFLEGVKEDEIRDITQFLEKDVIPDAVGKLKLAQADAGNTVTKARIDLMKNNIRGFQAVYAEGLDRIEGKLTSDMKTLATVEAKFQANTIKNATPINISTSLPSPQVMRTIVSGRPIQGRVLPDWFKDLKRSMQDKVTSQINIGMVQGESVDQITRRILGSPSLNFKDGVTKGEVRKVAGLVRTTVNHTASQAREETYKSNEDVVSGVQYVATLDARTTDICQSLDGKIFKVGQGPRPPMHHQCRSTTIPVLKSWKELGIDLKEAPAGTRASLNGQVPARQNYSQWLKKQPKSFQNKALGEERANLFRAGKLKIDKYQSKALLDTKASPKGIDAARSSALWRTLKNPQKKLVTEFFEATGSRKKTIQAELAKSGISVFGSSQREAGIKKIKETR